MKNSRLLLLLVLSGGPFLRAQDSGKATSIVPLEAPPPIGVSAVSAQNKQNAVDQHSDTSVPLDPGFNAVEASPPQQTKSANQPLTTVLSPAPQLQVSAQDNAAQARTSTSEVRTTSNLKDMRARVAESAYPETVRRQNGGYVSVNVPPGWKMVALRSLQYNPAPTIPLANGETYAVQSAPFVLIPAADADRVPVNPRSLQVLHNFYLANEELMRQLTEALKATNSVTRIE